MKAVLLTISRCKRRRQVRAFYFAFICEVSGTTPSYYTIKRLGLWP